MNDPASTLSALARPKCILKTAQAVLLALILGPCGDPSAANPVSIALFFQQMQSTIKEIRDSASSLMEKGNMIASQQQFLLAGLLESSLKQAETAYAKQLNSTVESLGGVEKEAFDRLDSLSLQFKGLQSKTVSDVRSLIQQTQSASNQLLASLPLTSRYPTFSEMLTRDVLSENDPNPADVRIYGFWLVDRNLNRPPEISVVDSAGKEYAIAPRGISAFFDRIDVQMPESVKTALRLQDTACDPRKTFRVKAKVFYLRDTPWYNFLSKHTLESQERTFNALPGDQQYSVSYTVSGRSTVAGSVDVPFTSTGSATQWSCEESKANSATYTMNSGGIVVGSPLGEWVELGGRWENQSCSASAVGTSVTAYCSVKGGNKNSIWSCAGGGNGKARVYGVLRRPTTTTTTFADAVVATTKLSRSATDSTMQTIPSLPNTIYTDVKMRISRASGQRVCAALEDEILLNLPVAQTGGILINAGRQTSREGKFEASANQNQITIRSLLPAIGKK